MSTVASAIQAAQDAEWSKIAAIGSLVLFIYDTSLTFSDEVELVWLRKMSPGSILYCLARYMSLLAVGLNLAVFFLLADSPDSQKCTTINTLWNIISLFAFIGVQGLVIALPYALFVSKRVVISTSIFFSGVSLILILIGTALYSSCNLSSGQRDHFTDVSFWQGICVIAADFVAFCATTYQIIRRSAAQADINQQAGIDFGWILIRQTAIRGLILFITIVGVILQKKATNPLIQLLVMPFQNTMVVLLLCRFSLDLRQDMMTSPRNLPEPPQALALNQFNQQDSSRDVVLGFEVTLTARSSTTTTPAYNSV